MADAAPVVHIGENSPEEVAHKLLISVALADGKSIRIFGGATIVSEKADRKWILDTYAECVDAVRGKRVYK